MVHFEDLMIKALKEQKDSLRESKSARAILKMLIEVRESARKNESYEVYDKITHELSEMGIDLIEETRITASLK